MDYLWIKSTCLKNSLVGSFSIKLWKNQYALKKRWNQNKL